MDRCYQCPRMCGVRRGAGEIGYCGMPGEIYVARASLHMWEEPCISGNFEYEPGDQSAIAGQNAASGSGEISVKSAAYDQSVIHECSSKPVTKKIPGSGTVFFTGCSLRCVYCQNHEIAAGKFGRAVSAQELADLFLRLEDQGAANINLVTPTHYTEQIIRALELVRHRLSIPIVSNTSGYERVEILRKLEDYVDIYLTDFKYMDSRLAQKYSFAADYPDIAKAALKEMVRQQPAPVFDSDGMMKSGVIVRHLMLPGQLMDSKHIVRYVYETCGDDVYLSLMNQYTPLEQVKDYPELNCRVKSKSYQKLIRYALDLGVVNAYMQSGEAIGESFIPPFVSGENDLLHQTDEKIIEENK